MVNSVIIEQLEFNGTLKTVELSSDLMGKIIISFPDEYTDKRNSPFHFQYRIHDKAVRKLFKANGIRRLDLSNFRQSDSEFRVNIPWRNIPTKSGELSYYAISLPEYAVPVEVVMCALFSPQPERKRSIKASDCNLQSNSVSE